MTLTGAEALVKILEAERVRFAFGLVGGKLAPLLHAISRTPDIRYVGARHESSAAMMAAAAYAGSGEIALALGEMGPGGLNLAAGTGVAFNNNLAALLITTNQHRAASYPHSGMFMDLDTAAVFKPITKWNAVVHDPRRIPELTRAAFRHALSGRPGPVHLDVPQDVLAAECTFADDEFDLRPARYRPVYRPAPAPDATQSAAECLSQAKKILIVAGGGVVTSGAALLLHQLAERLGAPVVATQMALGVLPSDSPYFVGHGGIIGGSVVSKAFHDADTIIAVGCRFSSWMWDDAGPLSRRHHRLVNINIDAEALGAASPHEVGIQADAALAMADLLKAVSKATISDRGWLRSLQQERRLEADRRTEAITADENAVMHPGALATAIADALPANAAIIYDGGHTTFWSNDSIPAREVRTRFHDPGMSHLGFGLPYAIALKLAAPDRPVINITGDGAFGFTLQELDTARRYGLPIVTIIHNNAAWGIIRAGQQSQLGFELGTSLDGTDYAAIARGFGCHGETVDHAAEMAPAMQRALASGKPSVIDCHTRFVPHPCLPAFGRMNHYGFDALTRTTTKPQRAKQLGRVKS